MRVTIKESGMSFGPFLEAQCFQIEKSNIYTKLQNGCQIALKVWLMIQCKLNSCLS
jgi:hypothetical protein